MKNNIVIIAAIAACIMTIPPLNASGETSDTASISVKKALVMLPTLSQPIDAAKKENLKGDNFAKSVAEKLSKSLNDLNILEAEYEKVYNTFKDKEMNDEQIKICDNFLQRRGEIIKSTLGDVEFAKAEFEKTTAKVNDIVGNIGANKEFATKAAQEMLKTKEVEDKIRNLERECDLIEAEEPKPGTQEYMAWSVKRLKIITAREDAIGEFDDAVFLNYVYDHYARIINVPYTQSVLWLKYIQNSSIEYATVIRQLKRAQTSNNIAISVNEASRSFQGITSLTNITTIATELAVKLQNIPRVSGNVTIPDPPPFIEISSDRIFDFDKRREEIKKMVNLPK